MLVEERPRPERVAGLVVLRLQVTVDRGDDREETREDAAGDEEADDPDAPSHDALHLLPDHEVAEATGHDQVEDEDEDRVLGVGRRRNDLTTTSTARGRWRGGGGGGGRRGVIGHSFPPTSCRRSR